MSKVIDLFAVRNQRILKEKMDLLDRVKTLPTSEEMDAYMATTDAPLESKKSDVDFEEVMKQNAARKEKILKDRQNRNEGVKRSFNIDKKK